MDSKRRSKLSKNGAVKRVKRSHTQVAAPNIAVPDIAAPDTVVVAAAEPDASDASDASDAVQLLNAKAVDESEDEPSADAATDIEVADAPISAQDADDDTGADAGDAIVEDAGEDTDDDTGDDTGDDAETAEAQVPERSPLVMNAVKIRGRPGGVAIEIGDGEWAELLAVLRERLEIAEGFFRGGRVVLDVGDRGLVETELRAAFDVLVDFEMQMAVVRSSAETTLETAAALGVTSTTSDLDDPLRGVVEVVQVEEESVREPTAYYVHQGNLRSGQVLERTESVIVIGDVNPGAQVVSHGDVLIYGRLRGSVHAGAEGDEQAMVTALEFAPTQLRIAAFTTVPPEDKKQSIGLLFWKKESDEQEAEYAYIADGRIYVEPWNAAKPGSMTSRRRR